MKLSRRDGAAMQLAYEWLRYGGYCESDQLYVASKALSFAGDSDGNWIRPLRVRPLWESAPPTRGER